MRVFQTWLLAYSQDLEKEVFFIIYSNSLSLSFSPISLKNSFSSYIYQHDFNVQFYLYLQFFLLMLPLLNIKAGEIYYNYKKKLLFAYLINIYHNQGLVPQSADNHVISPQKQEVPSLV